MFWSCLSLKYWFSLIHLCFFVHQDAPTILVRCNCARSMWLPWIRSVLSLSPPDAIQESKNQMPLDDCNNQSSCACRNVFLGGKNWRKWMPLTRSMKLFPPFCIWIQIWAHCPLTITKLQPSVNCTVTDVLAGKDWWERRQFLAESEPANRAAE